MPSPPVSDTKSADASEDKLPGAIPQEAEGTDAANNEMIEQLEGGSSDDEWEQQVDEPPA